MPTLAESVEPLVLPLASDRVQQRYLLENVRLCLVAVAADVLADTIVSWWQTAHCVCLGR